MVGHDGYKKMKGTNIHTAVSKEGLPLRLGLSAGNASDSRYFTDLADEIWVKGEKERPRARSDEIVADDAYDSKNIRRYLRKHGIKSNIPVNKRKRKNRKLGRPTRFNGWVYAFKRVAVRYERLEATFLGFLNLSCFLMLWRVLK